jgi:hypothetical protein
LNLQEHAAKDEKAEIIKKDDEEVEEMAKGTERRAKGTEPTKGRVTRKGTRTNEHRAKSD